jgi:hypothetical protein
MPLKSRGSVSARLSVVLAGERGAEAGEIGPEDLDAARVVLGERRAAAPRWIDARFFEPASVRRSEPPGSRRCKPRSCGSGRLWLLPAGGRRSEWMMRNSFSSKPQTMRLPTDGARTRSSFDLRRSAA